MSAPGYFAKNYDTWRGLFAEMFCSQIKTVNHEAHEGHTKEEQALRFLRGTSRLCGFGFCWGTTSRSPSSPLSCRWSDSASCRRAL